MADDESTKAPPSSRASEHEERICRYCFEGEESEELVSPCKCTGGQAFVHRSCLERWQVEVLQAQPPHPDFYDDDRRHKVCSVCRTEFSIEPPSRSDLMQQIIGDEVSELIEEDSFICAKRAFSVDLQRQLTQLPWPLRRHHPDQHWINGAFFLMKVSPDAGATLKLRINEKRGLALFAEALSPRWTWQARGRQYQLLFEGPLADAADLDAPGRRAALVGLRTPCTLLLTSTNPGDVGEDGISAVNLTRLLVTDLLAQGGEGPSVHDAKAKQFQKALRKVLEPNELFQPKVAHFIGGPCRPERVEYAIVILGPMDFKKVVGMPDALDYAQRIYRARLALAGSSKTEEVDRRPHEEHREDPPPKRRRLMAWWEGQWTKPESSKQDPSCSSSSSSARPQASISRGAPEESAPGKENAAGNTESEATKQFEADLRLGSAADVRVLIFWGTAEWKRCQLMAEIAQGSWGLCRHETSDVTATDAGRLYQALYPRLSFAPRTKMSETFEDEGNNAAPEEAVLDDQEALHEAEGPALWQRRLPRHAAEDPDDVRQHDPLGASSSSSSDGEDDMDDGRGSEADGYQAVFESDDDEDEEEEEDCEDSSVGDLSDAEEALRPRQNRQRQQPEDELPDAAAAPLRRGGGGGAGAVHHPDEGGNNSRQASERSRCSIQ